MNEGVLFVSLASLQVENSGLSEEMLTVMEGQNITRGCTVSATKILLQAQM